MSAMPAANSREELTELELSTECSTFSPAAACSPTGQPLSQAGAWRVRSSRGVALCVGRVTVGCEARRTPPVVAAGRTVAVEVDTGELICVDTEVRTVPDVAVLSPEVLGHGTACGEPDPPREGGGDSGLGPACADSAANAVTKSAQPRTNTLPTTLRLAFTTRAPPLVADLGC
jgi:hypothetical protein